MLSVYPSALGSTCMRDSTTSDSLCIVLLTGEINVLNDTEDHMVGVESASRF